MKTKIALALIAGFLIGDLEGTVRANRIYRKLLGH